MKSTKYQDNNGNSQGLMARTFQTLVHFRIALERESLKLNKFQIFLVLLIQALQELGLLVVTYQSIHFKDAGGNVVDFLANLSRLVRPYEFLNNNQVQSWYLIPLIFIVGIQGPLFMIMMKYSKKKSVNLRMTEQLRKTNFFIKTIANAYIYTSLIFNQILLLPFVDMIVLTINNIYELEGFNTHMLFAFIALVLVIYCALFELLISNESLFIHCNNFQTLNQSLQTGLNQFMILCLCFIHIFTKDLSNRAIYLSLLLIVISSTTIVHHIISYSNLYYYTKLSLQLNVLITVGSIVIFLNQIDQSHNHQEFSVIIIFYPIASYVILSFYEKQHQRAMIPRNESQCPKQIQYRIANILQMYSPIAVQGIVNIRDYLLFIVYKLEHLNQCTDKLCQCNREGTKQEYVIMCYLKDNLKQLQFAIQNIPQQNRFIYFLHYLSLINELGLKQKAFQLSQVSIQSDREIYQSSGKQMVRLSNQNSSHTIDNKSKYAGSSDKNTDTLQLHQIKVANMSSIQKLKLSILQNIIRNSINSEFGQTVDKQQDDIEHSVKLFLQAEYDNYRIKTKIVKMIMLKNTYFQALMKCQSAQALFQQSKNIIIKLSKLETVLLQMYQQFPSQKMQALNSFYQAEIMNNYYQAYKISNVVSISDEKLLKMHKKLNFDLFSNKLDYLKVIFDQSSQHLVLQGHSNSAPEFFGIQVDQFKQIKTLGPLLPQHFEQIHSILVMNFLQNGQSKYFRQINRAYCSYQFQLIKPINLFYDVNYLNMNDLGFAVFLQNCEDQSAYIFVSHRRKICGVSSNFASAIGYRKSNNESINFNCVRQNITRIIPQFNDYLERQIKHQLNETFVSFTQESVVMNMPKEDHLTLLSKFNWKQYSQLNHFNIDLAIQGRQIENQAGDYYILEIKSARLNENSINSYTQINNTKNTSKSKSSNDFEDINLLETPLEEVAQCPNQLFEINPTTLGQLHVKFPGLDSPNNVITSPRLNELPLIQKQPKTSIKQSKSQIQYFAKQNLRYSDCDSEHKQQLQAIQDPVQNIEVDQQLKEDLMQQMQMKQEDVKVYHIDDIGSQVSSIAGFRTSKYFKKYELIERMITSTQFSLSFRIMLAFIILVNCLVIFQSSLYIQNSGIDLHRFKEELDMVQIKVNIMGPIDKFIVSINAQLDYFILFVVYNTISQEEAFIRKEYSSREIISSYNQLRESLNTQLTNPYLQPFFQDKYIVVKQSNYLELVEYNITIREALNLYIESFFMFLKIDFNQILTLDTSKPHFVYSFSNYATFSDLFQTLTTEILTHSNDRALEVQQKWYAFGIPIIVINTILILIAYSYYHQYIGEYCSILTLFKYVDVFWLNKDIDRYKIFIDLLQKDENVLFGYRFDINLKEKLLEIEEKKQEQIKLKYIKVQKQQLGLAGQPFSLHLYKSVVVFGFVTLIYIAISAGQNFLGQQYFKKYPSTTNLFNKISDLCLASSGIFAMRELSYQIKYPDGTIYYFFKDKNANYFLNKFDQHIELVGEMLVELDKLKHDDYLVTDTFFNQLNDVMTQDICQYLPEDKIELAQPHCDKIYHGVLRRGYQIALVSIRDSIVNEKISTNNFTLKVYTNNEELEAGLIGSDVMNMLKETFQTELSQYTNNLIISIIVISLVCMISSTTLTLILLTTVIKYYKVEFIIVNRSILLLPQTSLFIDTQLDRNIRQIIVKGQLI